MKRLHLCLLGMCFGLLVTPAIAAPIFAITLPTNVVHLNPARSGTLVFTAKNVSGVTLKNLSVPQTRFLTSAFSATVESNTCDNITLTNNQSCTVTLNISGVADGSANLSPIVCAFSGLVCSHGSVTIKVDNIQQRAPVTSLAANLPDNVQVGTAYPVIATFLNPDTQNTMTGVSITNPPVNSVQTANTCQSGVLAPLASCQVSYLFTAPSSGSYHLTGTFNYNEGDPIINSKTVLASEAAIAGSVVVGLPANVKKDKTYPVIFRYTNFGTADATYNTIPTPVPTLGTFTPQVGLTHPCSGGTLAKGGYCDVSGTYTAGAVGSVMLSSTLTATGPGTINPVPLATSSTASDVAITGTVFPELPTSITPGVSYPVVFTFTNADPVLSAEKVSIDKLLPSPNFTQTSDTCGATLAAGASCAIGGDFQTSVEGPVALTVLFDHDDNASVPLTTSSEATAATLVGTVNGFAANVDKDTAHTVTFTFSNHGSKAAVVNSTTLSFPNIDGTPTDNCNGQTIAPGGSCTITGTFKNAPLGATTWSATVNYNGGIGGSPIDVVKTTNTTVGETIVTGTDTSTPTLPTTVALGTNHAFQFTFTNSASSPTAASGLQFVTAMPHVTGLTNSCSGVSTLAPGGTCVISGTFNSAHSGPQTLSATLLYNQGAPVTISATTNVLSVLAITYQNQIAAMANAGEPIQWISANFPDGFTSLPTTYPTTVSTVRDVNNTTNTYTIALNGGGNLQIIKDGVIGNAFHFTGNQSLYTASSTISTQFTIVALMRKPTSNIGRLLTGYINGSTNMLMGYWSDKQDAWYIQTNGKLDVGLTTNANLYIFSNNNGTKTMYKYPAQGTAETVVQSATTIGGNNWGRVVYGRPLVFATEAATNAYIYDVMVFNRVLTPAERSQIVTFYQSVYPYWP